jgi:hypothetical protein
MQDEHDTTADEQDTGAKNADNNEPEEGAGQKGAGSETGALGGLDGGAEPGGNDVQNDNRA